MALGVWAEHTSVKIMLRLLPLIAVAAVLWPADRPTRAVGDPVIIAAGDIADCNSPGDEATAAVLAGIEGTVITLGDNAYESGTTTEFNTCYDPTWGPRKGDTKPSPGNHEYQTAGAAGYFGYFGAVAGNPTQGWYSFDLGDWHVVSLNSNCSAIGGCGAGSLQETWLRADLAAHPAACTLAYWHHSRFSSGLHGDNVSMQPLWQALYDYGADLVLNGHDHSYERFAPQTPAGVADPAFGIREIIAGTGGRALRAVGAGITNSEVQDDKTWGVLKLTLHAASYDFEFMPVAGTTFTDSGTASCHGPTLPDADGDHSVDAADNCPADANTNQANNDRNFVSNAPYYVNDDTTRVASDTAGDVCDPDDDNDGLADVVEAAGSPCLSATVATYPSLSDSDGDLAVDGAECALGSDPAASSSKPPLPAAGTDTDRDGLSAAFEATIGTSPVQRDSDGDGLLDGWEVKGHGSDPLSSDGDADGVRDGCEVASVNGDTVVNPGDQAMLAAETVRSPPRLVNFDMNRDTAVNVGDQAFQSSKVLPGQCP